MSTRITQFFHSVLLSAVCFSVSAESLETNIVTNAGNTKVKEIAFVDAGIKNTHSTIIKTSRVLNMIFNFSEFSLQLTEITIRF